MKGVLDDWKIHDYEEVKNSRQYRPLSIATILVRRIYSRLCHFGADRLARFQHYENIEHKQFVKQLEATLNRRGKRR